MQKLIQQVDHLVFVVDDLMEGMDYFEKLTGVRPVIGGQHQGEGTWNALFSLGEGIFFEIISRDPKQEKPQKYSWLDAISGKGNHKLIRWAARGKSLEVVTAKAKEMDLDIGDALHGERLKADGSLLSWTLTDLKKDPLNGIFPFFLDWGNSQHPSTVLPQGCTLKGFKAFHPNPEMVQSYFDELNIFLKVEFGETPALEAEIMCPKGVIYIK